MGDRRVLQSSTSTHNATQFRRLDGPESIFGKNLDKPLSSEENDESVDEVPYVGDVKMTWSQKKRLSWNVAIFFRAFNQIIWIGLAAVLVAPYAAHSLALVGVNAVVVIITSKCSSLESGRQKWYLFWGVCGLTLTGLGGAWWMYGWVTQVLMLVGLLLLVALRFSFPVWRWRKQATLVEAVTMNLKMFMSQLNRNAPSHYLHKQHLPLQILIFLLSLAFCPFVVLSYLAVDVCYESRGAVAFAIASPIVAFGIGLSRVAFNVVFAASSVWVATFRNSGCSDICEPVSHAVSTAVKGLGTWTKFSGFDLSSSGCFTGLVENLLEKHRTKKLNSWFARVHAAIRGIGFTHAFNLAESYADAENETATGNSLIDHGAVVFVSMLVGAWVGCSVGGIGTSLFLVAPETPAPLLLALVGAWFGMIASGALLGVMSAADLISSIGNSESESMDVSLNSVE